MNYWATVYRVAFAVVIVMATMLTISAFMPKIQKYHESFSKRDQYREENRLLNDEIKKLRTNQERFASDPTFVERTARDIGMVKPDEMVFKYTNEEGTAESATP